MSSNYFVRWTEDAEDGRGPRIHHKLHIGLNCFQVRFRFRAYVNREASGADIRSWSDWRLFLTSRTDFEIFNEDNGQVLSLMDFLKLVESTKKFEVDKSMLQYCWVDGEGWWFIPYDFE